MKDRARFKSLVALALALAPAGALAQGLDICGCAGSSTSLGAFDSNIPASWPPGTTISQECLFSTGMITIPLPADGVMVFDSFRVSNSHNNQCNVSVTFARNAANTPVTLLVRGSVLVDGLDVLSVSGSDGSNGTATTAGVGSRGGPGGFVGGDGAYQAANLAVDGGDGIGPGGGSRGTAAALAAGGTFFGVPELRPLVGGSGGGGGRSTSPSADCSGGGGGGGGGAILIAANGTLSVAGTIQSNAGRGGNPANFSGCAGGGGGGSGGAIRLVANTIAGGGRIEATGAGANFGGTGGAGSIRMESIQNTFGSDVNPPAMRVASPDPLVNAVNPTVRIARVQGADTPANPLGFLGQIDMIVPSPGPVQLELVTQDVPVGTDVLVTVKPKVGAGPLEQRVTLVAGSCIGGVCAFDATFDLAAGAYVAEARATFEVQ